MRRQQIVVSGIGGQGVLFLTRILAQAALQRCLPVLTAETHGMAQRGGSVVSHLKVGPFHGPLIRPGTAAVLLGLWAAGIEAHRHLLGPEGRLFVNSRDPDNADAIDATGIAAALGNPVAANLVLLGFAAGRGALFCTADDVAAALAALVDPARLETSAAALRRGVAMAAERSRMLP